jgi:hypothetical protein
MDVWILMNAQLELIHVPTLNTVQTFQDHSIVVFMLVHVLGDNMIVTHWLCAVHLMPNVDTTVTVFLVTKVTVMRRRVVTLPTSLHTDQTDPKDVSTLTNAQLVLPNVLLDKNALTVLELTHVPMFMIHMESVPLVPMSVTHWPFVHQTTIIIKDTIVHVPPVMKETETFNLADRML